VDDIPEVWMNIWVKWRFTLELRRLLLETWVNLEQGAAKTLPGTEAGPGAVQAQPAAVD